jgi:hypothetical protein
MRNYISKIEKNKEKEKTPIIGKESELGNTEFYQYTNTATLTHGIENLHSKCSAYKSEWLLMRFLDVCCRHK